MWHGRLRDYYDYRWQIWYYGKMQGKDDQTISNEVHQYEDQWVADSTLSRSPAPKDIVKACRDLVNFADSIDISNWEWPDLKKKK